MCRKFRNDVALSQANLYTARPLIVNTNQPIKQNKYHPVAQIAGRVLFMQLIISILLALTIWLVAQNSVNQHIGSGINSGLAALYGGLLSIIASLYLALMLLLKSRKAALKNQSALAVKGMGTVQVGRYALIIAGIYIGIKLWQLPGLPIILALAFCQLGGWFGLRTKSAIGTT